LGSSRARHDHRNHTRNNDWHIARAALESIAYQVADLIQTMQDDSGIPIHELRVDGGAARNDTLLQFQADLLGIPVVRQAVTEMTFLGAAFLAGLGLSGERRRSFLRVDLEAPEGL
jgi:glycerol kinase